MKEVTKEYYDKNAQSYIDETFSVNMSPIEDPFLAEVGTYGKILDVGFGSGRDSKYFMMKGYDPYSLDYEEAFIKHAKEINLPHPILGNIEDIDYDKFFDGIYCCASLGHIPSDELNGVLKKLAKALKDDGTMYLSFRYGEFEGVAGGRYLTYMTEKTLPKYLEGTGLVATRYWFSKDFRVSNDTTWLNVFLSKETK
ncbi:MAG: class I SAM-dependent methyltransferase [Bacilli bacterium]|jgi:SAM-dependent methyltransferase